MKRFLELDVFRGVAIVMMVIFHLMYDLNSNRLVSVSLYVSPFWIIFRHIILFLFVGISGACVYLIHRNGIRWNRVLAWAVKIGVAAGIVTIATYYYDPSRVVILGILQFLFIANLLALLFLKKPQVALFLGIVILAIGFIGNVNEKIHFIPYLVWIGFGSKTLRSFDMVPMIPVFGYTLIGIWMMHQALQENRDYLWIPLNPLTWWNRSLAFLGKHSLLLYFLHRLLIMGVIKIMLQWR